MKRRDRVSAEWQEFTKLPELTTIEVGIFEDAGTAQKIAGDGQGPVEATLAEIASFHEFGLGVPQRSFLRAWFDENEERLFATFVDRLGANGPTGWAVALNQVALWVQADIQLRITKHIPPPLKKATVDRKKSSTPLIDTGQLRAAITARVNGKPPA